MLCDISLDTSGWDGYPAQYTTANLQFPESCRKNRSRPLDPESDISREDEEEVASEIGENLFDDEDLAMGFVFGGEIDDDDEGLEDVLSDDESGEEEEERNEQGETKAGKGHEYESAGRAGEYEDLPIVAQFRALLDFQQYLPADMQAEHQEALMDFAQLALSATTSTTTGPSCRELMKILSQSAMGGTTSTTAAAPSRLELLKQAIITPVTERGTGSDMTTEELAQTPLGSWRSLNHRINTEFNLEEITAFSAELEDKDNFM